MQSPYNLTVFVRAKELTSRVYAATTAFPTSERFGLTSQMRRAAVSIPANIAEGCGRSGNRALIAFLHIAMGSATELECLIDIASDLELSPAGQAATLRDEVTTLQRMISRLIIQLRARPDLPDTHK